MTPEQIRKRIGANFPDQSKFEQLLADESAYQILVGVCAFDQKNVPYKLRKWAHDEALGKITSLGVFLTFLRERAQDQDFVDIWSDFLSQSVQDRADVAEKARVQHAARFAKDIEQTEGGDIFYDRIMSDPAILGKVKNPRYLMFKPTRALFTMVKERRIHFDVYYAERTLTEYFFPDEAVTLR